MSLWKRLTLSRRHPPGSVLGRTFFDRAAHRFDLAIGPRMVGLRQAVRNPVCTTDHVEAHWPRIDGIAVPLLFGELDDIARCPQFPRHLPSSFLLPDLEANGRWHAVVYVLAFKPCESSGGGNATDVEPSFVDAARFARTF